MYSKTMFLFLHVLKYRSIFPQSDIVNFFVKDNGDTPSYNTEFCWYTEYEF